ncbi:hypothetical protein Taro_000347, partial [Colocasia esculenta]|nr:hypothetical protein [Colocasia esculenta]
LDGFFHPSSEEASSLAASTVGFVILLLGMCHYQRPRPGESPFIGLIQVVVAAARKLKVTRGSRRFRWQVTCGRPHVGVVGVWGGGNANWRTGAPEVVRGQARGPRRHWACLVEPPQAWAVTAKLFSLLQDVVLTMIRDGSYDSKFAEFQRAACEARSKEAAAGPPPARRHVTDHNVKSNQSFVFTKGWNSFVKTKKLHAKDIVTFYRCETGACTVVAVPSLHRRCCAEPAPPRGEGGAPSSPGGHGGAAAAAASFLPCSRLHRGERELLACRPRVVSRHLTAAGVR